MLKEIDQQTFIENNSMPVPYQTKKITFLLSPRLPFPRNFMYMSSDDKDRIKKSVFLPPY